MLAGEIDPGSSPGVTRQISVIPDLIRYPCSLGR